MKILITIFFAIALCANLKAQHVTVYETYDDFKNNKGKEYEKLSRYIFTNLSGSLVVTNGTNKSIILWKSVWGFKIDTTLFRIYDREAYRIVVSGPKLCYYDDGKSAIASILGQRFDREHGIPTSFLSKSLESDLITIFRTGESYNETKQIAKLKIKLPEPEYKPFFDCLNTYVYTSVLLDCVRKFQQ
jgi:hypothetical protein